MGEGGELLIGQFNLYFVIHGSKIEKNIAC